MADKVEFADKDVSRDAIKEVRNEKSESDWVLFGYESGKANTIVLLGKGSGGVSGFVDKLSGDMVGYALVRKIDVIDNSSTTKFAFIFWLGDQIKGLQKARISVHRGQVTDFLGQFHVDFTVSSKDEISDDIVLTKIRETSGSASKVLDGTGQRATSALSTSTRSGGGAVAKNLEIADESGIKAAVREVRNGALGWVLLSYENNGASLALIAKGTGDASELKSHLSDSIVAYGLIRKVEEIDQTKADKFAFIKFQGASIPVMLKARLGTHMGTVTQLLSPYHVTLDVTSPDEISDDIIMNSINAASGTKVNVLADNGAAPKQTSLLKGDNLNLKGTPSKAAPGAVPKPASTETSAIKFTDENAIRDAIKEVRKDNISPRTDWVLVGYEGGKGNTLTLLGKGSNGLSEALPHLNDTIVAYALLRKTDRIDQTDAVKFVFVEWIGENIDRMHKARLSTYSGAVNALFAPWHVDLRQVSSLSELTDENIQNRVMENSGTKSKVKN